MRQEVHVLGCHGENETRRLIGFRYINSLGLLADVNDRILLFVRGIYQLDKEEAIGRSDVSNTMKPTIVI